MRPTIDVEVGWTQRQTKPRRADGARQWLARPTGSARIENGEPNSMHDLVIRGAAIMDGSGDPAFPGAIAVAGGRIAAVARHGGDLGRAAETIDADGLALAPGIIDGHTHYDAQITWDPWVDPSPSVGVTTVVIGNCGFTIAPCRPADREITMRNLTHVEGMSLDALRAGIRWDFESFPEYLAMIEQAGVVPNVAAFVGHSSVRTYVLRDDACTRAATAPEIERMAAIVREAMTAGAVGFASSTNEPHNGEGGVPMPSRLADADEVHALVRAMGEGGRGVYMLTKGSKTTPQFLESVAAGSGRPVVVAAMLHNSTNPDAVFAYVEALKSAEARGHRLVPQVSCTPLTMDFTLANPYPLESVDAWLPAMQASPEALPSVYRDPSFRAAVKADLDRFRGRRLFNSQWDRVVVCVPALAANAGLEGRSVAALAAERDRHPLDMFLDLALEEELETVFTAELMNTDEAAVGRLVADPATHVALSDAGAHLTFLCDADFGLHLLGHWARDRGVLTLEQAVRKLTAMPAALFGLTDRGRIAPGLAADLMLFDPATVGRGPRRRVNDLPAGAPRFTVGPKGLVGVWVNGVRIVDEAGPRPSAGRPGRLLREFA
jgi:N-acyl-D-aspartate/D-glutamate deacylase